jgi:hypothetical protein
MTQHIKNFLKQFVSKSDWKLDLIAKWPMIIGTLNDKVTLEHVDETSITLGVNNSSWMQELYLLSPMLRDIINKHLDKPRIKDIRFKNVTFKAKDIPYSTVIPHKKNKPVTLSSKELETLNNIKNAELRDVLKQFLIRCHQERS